MEIEKIQSMLEEIRQEQDLLVLKHKIEGFCEKHNVTTGQANWLLSVVAAERYKKMTVN